MKNDTVCKFSDVRSSDLICTDFVYETSNAQACEVTLDANTLGIVVKGKGKLTAGSTAHELNCKDIFFSRKRTPFSISFEGEHGYLYVRFSGRRADELIERSGISGNIYVTQFPSDFDMLVSFGFDCLEKAEASNLDILSEAMLLYLFGHLSLSGISKPELLNAIIAITNENFSDCSFSLSALSDMLGYDTKYISSYFSKSKGITYVQYLRNLRIDHAVFLMEQGISCIKNIALLSGFSDSLYFSKIFKRIKGVSPKDYISSIN